MDGSFEQNVLREFASRLDCLVPVLGKLMKEAW